jgi:hypothetical protein
VPRTHQRVPRGYFLFCCTLVVWCTLVFRQSFLLCSAYNRSLYHIQIDCRTAPALLKGLAFRHAGRQLRTAHKENGIDLQVSHLFLLIGQLPRRELQQAPWYVWQRDGRRDWEQAGEWGQDHRPAAVKKERGAREKGEQRYPENHQGTGRSPWLL